MSLIRGALSPSRKLAFNLGVGFGVALILLLGVIGLGVHQMKLINGRLERIVEVNNVKSRLASHMRDTLRDRAIVMHDMVVSIDTWEKEDLFEKFLSYGEQYAKDRNRLAQLLETQDEKKLLAKLDQITASNQPIMFDVAEAAREQNNYGALTLLQQQAIPLQGRLVDALDEMSLLQREATEKAAKETFSAYKETRSLMLGLGTLATLLAVSVAWLVSRRVATQTRQLDSEKLKFQTLFESNSDAVVILDEKGFIDCNPATVRLFGMDSAQKFLSSSIPDLGAARQGPNLEDACNYARRMLGLARTEGHAFMEWQGRRMDGSLFPAEIALHAMELEGRPVIQAILRDISERKQVEQAMAKARDAALSAARTKSEFVANVSHEIRTPLHGIQGMTDLLLKAPLLSADQREYALTLKQSAASLLAVINDLLDFSKIEAGKLRLEELPFDLRSLIEEVINLYRPRALEKGLSLEAAGLDDLTCCVLGDPHRLRQVLLNLVDNAFKFTPQGEIRVSVQRLDDKHYRITVTDSGIGILPQNMPHLFEAFSQADSSTTRRFGGTGLGLTISRQLVELMGGSIEVHSPPPGQARGTCFILNLPLPATAGKPRPALDTPASRFHGRALVVEDNPVNQRVVLYQLNGLGLEVEVADSAPVALKRLHQDPRWDVIFMDWQMPEMDGIAAAQAIRALPPPASQIPIVVLTANAAPGFREACLKAGMDDYLSKPYSEDAMSSVLSRWLPAQPSPNDAAASESTTSAESGTEQTPDQPLALAQLRARYGKDGSILDEMLKVFLDSTESLLLELNGALESADNELAARKCHSLRGAAAAVLATPLMRQAGDLEAALKLGDIQSARGLMEDLEAEFIRVRHYLEHCEPAVHVSG
ncbi:MAG TPA: ATP-binding protein, partial [Thiobacillaceae bacterium]|nr:ATP-binding protein [Thiobacillaceae bacterium]